jgi:hypothetical protein
MKTKFLPVLFGIILSCYTINSNAQANQKLSNLTSPTAINQSLLPGVNNTINLGKDSLRWKNVYLGNALYLKGAISIHMPGTNNFFVGFNAGNTSLTGYNNTGTGLYSLFSLTSGKWNTANGYYALASNSTGSANTSTGYNSLRYNSTGYSNTANGSSALTYNSTGYANIANGSTSLYHNTSGYANTASGVSSMYSNTTGNSNTATGYYSMYFNIMGGGNTAMGYESLFYNASGHYNTASGYYSLYHNTGGRNTASGGYSLYKNTTGSYNTASGDNSLNSNTTGRGNTAIGSLSLTSNYTGSYNTALGYAANVATVNYTNATVIGYGALVGASNKVQIGNTSVTSIGGQVGWSTFSDGRYKKDIKENVPGLAFITQLRPVTYTVDIDKLDEVLSKKVPATDDELRETRPKPSAEELASRAANARFIHTGFVAQEVEKEAKKLNYEFSGVDAPKNDNDFYGLRYAEFVVPLVKAVQELNQKVIEENKQLRDELAELRQMVIELKNHNTNNTTSLLPAYLEQNIPNPTGGSTVIRYYLPQNVSSAQLVVTDARGQIVKSITLNSKGSGQISLNTHALTAGTYTYSLLIDRKQADSKQLVVIR